MKNPESFFSDIQRLNEIIGELNQMGSYKKAEEVVGIRDKLLKRLGVLLTMIKSDSI